MKRLLYFIVAVSAMLSGSQSMAARDFNDKLLNRPYADNRRWHLGFSVGAFVQDLSFVHNGFVTEDGESWYMDQPSYSPGFCVNGLFDLRLNNYFNVRVSPGMYFGNRDIKFVDVNNPESKERQNLKSAYVVAPIDLKYSAVRLRNIRPYVTTGFMAAFDVSKKRSDFIKLKSTDLYWTIGFGCDLYLPYFKLIPELKFCLGLTDVLQTKRPDLVDDPGKLKYTQSLKKATSKMFVLTFYFE
ncbi:MAG: porin family protein [Muribaculaceae bacterium]